MPGWRVAWRETDKRWVRRLGQWLRLELRTWVRYGSVIKERSKWLQDIRNVGFLGLGADQLCTDLRRCMLFVSPLHLSALPSPTCSPFLLSEEKSDVWFLVGCVYPSLFPYPLLPARFFSFWLTLPLSLPDQCPGHSFSLHLETRVAPQVNLEVSLKFPPRELLPLPGWCHPLFRVVPGEEWDKRWSYLLSYL